MKRVGAFFGLTLVALVAIAAGVAGAAVSLDKASVPASTTVDVVLQVTVEELVGYNQKVVLAVPEGFQVLACTAPAGYRCGNAAASNPTRTLVTWENVMPAPNEFGLTPTVRFPFRMRSAASTGDYKFDVDQTYSNGANTKWNGAKGSANAAPVLSVTGQGTPAVTNTTVPSDTTDTTSSTSDTTPSSPTPSFDLGSTTNTTLSFGDVSTPTSAGATATTVAGESTDTTLDGLAADVISTSGDEDGIRGTERIVLIGLAAIALGSAAFASFRARNA